MRCHSHTLTTKLPLGQATVQGHPMGSIQQTPFRLGYLGDSYKVPDGKRSGWPFARLKPLPTTLGEALPPPEVQVRSVTFVYDYDLGTFNDGHY